MTTTNLRNENQFFELRLSIYAGSNERKAFDLKALTEMGFKEVDFDAVRAVLNTDILPKEAFQPFLAIRKSAQDFLAEKGQSHPLMGRVFNPKDRVEIIEFIRVKQEEYEAEKKIFVSRYSSYVQAQLDVVQNSAILKGLDPLTLMNSVKQVQPPVSYYERKMKFRFFDVSITLDSDEWQDIIDSINSDIVEKTIYELSRDSNVIRDNENPRSRAKKLLELSERLKAMDFYIPGLGSLAEKIDVAIKDLGGVKPAKDYSQRESLMLSSLARLLDENARSVVHGTNSFEDLTHTEKLRVDAILSEEVVESVQTVKPVVKQEESGIEQVAKVKASESSFVGTYSF